MKTTGSVFTLALAAGAAFFLAETGVSHAAGVCDQISGTYSGPAATKKSTAAIVLGADGKTLNGELGNGARPNFYGTCDNGKIDVKFSDDQGCCTGTFDGTTISWSNRTQWVKDPRG